MRYERTPIYLFFACVLATAVLGMLAALYGMSTIIQFSLSISLLLAGLSLVAAGCMAAWSRGRMRRWMLSGMISCALAMVCWTPGLWILVMQGQGLTDWLIIACALSCWSVVMMCAGLLYIPRFTLIWLRLLRLCTLMAVVLLAALVVAGSIVIPALQLVGVGLAESAATENLMRAFGVLVILVSVGFLFIWLMARMPTLSGRDSADDQAAMRFSCACPRCNAACELQTGGDACRACGLNVRVIPL